MFPDAPMSFPSAKACHARSPETCNAGCTLGASKLELKRQRNQKLGVGVAIAVHSEVGCQVDSSSSGAAQPRSSPFCQTQCCGSMLSADWPKSGMHNSRDPKSGTILRMLRSIRIKLMLGPETQR